MNTTTARNPTITLCSVIPKPLFFRSLRNIIRSPHIYCFFARLLCVPQTPYLFSVDLLVLHYADFPSHLSLLLALRSTLVFCFAPDVLSLQLICCCIQFRYVETLNNAVTIWPGGLSTFSFFDRVQLIRADKFGDMLIFRFTLVNRVRKTILNLRPKIGICEGETCGKNYVQFAKCI